ncbi:MAG: LysR family transcriptional regulator [Oscillibacter sp.]|nr:LysR family transcriptional regulator [Oscillibacter sp.]
MNITQVRYVLAVAEHGSMSRAAESLFLSQPALSLQIKKLEDELGFPLFFRTAQGVTLTEEGKAFCGSAREVTKRWQALEETVEKLGRKHRERLCLRLGPRVFTNQLFPDIVAFFDGHPELEPTFIVVDDGNFLEDLAAGAIDVALTYLPPAELIPDARRFSCWPLIRERQCILVGDSDPLAGQAQAAFDQLGSRTLITTPENSMESQVTLWTLQQHGVTPGRLYRLDVTDTVMDLVRAGKGVALGPLSAAKYYGLRAVPLDPPMEESLSFICLRESQNRPALRQLRRYLQDICKADC